MKQICVKPIRPNYVLLLARKLRKNSSDAERLLWERLRGKRLKGMKFRRQAVFGRYILDFYCPKQRLCIEVDGTSHQGREEYDSERTLFLESAGIKVLRFENLAVHQNIDKVLQTIMDSCTNSPSPASGFTMLGAYRGKIYSRSKKKATFFR
jgi:very-short-patch-repair endonuclease